MYFARNPGSASAVLEMIERGRMGALALIGGLPGNLAEVASAGGWVVVRSSAHRDGRGTVRLRSADRVRSLLVLDAARWIGDVECEPGLAHKCWEHLYSKVGAGIASLGRQALPSSLGLSLVCDACYPDCPTRDRDHVDRIMQGGGITQGRFEALPPPPDFGGVNVSAIHEIDLRDAYLRVASGLEIATKMEWVEWDEPPRIGNLPYYGYALCEFRAPSDWGHVGLLPSRTGAVVSYPAEGEGWVSLQEARLAVGRGWSVQPRLGWIDAGRSSVLPFSALVYRAEMASRRHDCGEEGAPVLRQMAKSVVYQTIAACASRGPVRSVTVDDWGLVPDDEMAIRTAREVAGKVQYETRGTGPEWEPDWPDAAWAVWSTVRRQLLSMRGDRGATVGALSIPRETVLGFALDAIYTSEVPEWASGDGSKPYGRWRAKRSAVGPMPWPKSLAEIQRAIRETEGGEECKS